MLSTTYITSAFIIFIMMSIIFLIAIVKKDNSIVDVFWGLGFTINAWIIFILYKFPFGITSTIFVTIWGLRLAIYLFLRNNNKGEDWRYAQWRKDWGKYFYIRSYLQVFMLQGFMMWIISFPLLQIDNTFIPIQLWQYGGALLWLIGFLWESIADFQLYQFKQKSKNKGKIMQTGLWAYSRHPNYFGEILVWWGIFIFCLPYGKWYITILSPIVITWLLNNVSGVPMLEEKYKQNKNYQKYIQKTNALIPKFW